MNITIKNLDGRVVEGVKRVEDADAKWAEWVKWCDGVKYVYPHSCGWEEVKASRWVDTTANVRVEQRELMLDTGAEYAYAYTYTYKLPTPYGWRKRDLYDLPDDPLGAYIKADGHVFGIPFTEFAQRWKRPCLVIEKEEIEL